MRKSVEQRLHQQATVSTSRGFWRRHWLVFTIIIALLLIDGGILYYLQQKDIQDTKHRDEEHSKQMAAADATIKRLKQEKIERARKAEEEAKKKAAEEEAQRKAAAAAKPAGTVAAPSNCGVSNPASITVVVNKNIALARLPGRQAT